MADNVLLPTNSIVIIRGTSKTIELTVTDQDDDPVNLTGARIVFCVKKHIDDTHGIISKSSDQITEIEITSPLGGIAKIYLNPSDTQDKDVGEYIFDVWTILASGKRFVVVGPSTFEIEASVCIIPL